MKKSDEQIIATVRKILDILHDPKTGFNGFRRDLSELKLEKNEYEAQIDAKLDEIAKKHGMKTTAKNIKKFIISGKDVMENRFYTSCGHAAKAFCYVNSQLSKEEQLDLMVLLSTDPEHLVDGMAGHTLPCVQLSDGKWHAIEPQIKPGKKYPGFDFVCDNVVPGADIWHILDGIKEKGRPYKIIKMVTPEYQANELSDFGRFLNETTIRKGKLGLACATIELLLKSHNFGKYNGRDRQTYELCKLLENKNDTLIKVLIFGDGHNFTAMPGIKDKEDYYGVSTPEKKYLDLWRVPDTDGIAKYFREPNFKLQKIMSPTEYIKYFESTIIKGKTNGKVL